MTRPGNEPDKREQILAAALHLFTTRGFHDTPTSQISRQAGVSTGTLFHYFPDKNTLIDQLYLSIKKEMAGIFREGDDPSLPIQQRLRETFSRYARWGMANPEKARFIGQFHHSPNISEAVHTEAFLEFRGMDELFLEAIREGILTDRPVQYHLVMAFQVIGGILQLIEADDTGMTPDELIASGIGMLWRSRSED